MTRKRVLIQGKHSLTPRLTQLFVEKRYEVLFEPDEKPADLCLVTQRACLAEVLDLLPKLVDAPTLLVTDAAIYHCEGEPPSKSMRGMDETKPILIDYREEQLAQQLLEHSVARLHSSKIIVRAFDVYGPGVIDGIIPQWVDLCRSGKTLEYDVDVHRTFLYIDDFLEVIRKLENRLADVHYDVFNVGATEMISLSRLGYYIWTMTYGQDSSVEVKERELDEWPRPLDGQAWRLPNIRRVQGFTSWHPRVSLRQGLFHCIDYLSKR